LARALMISFPDRIGSFLDNDGYQLAAFLLRFGLVLFKDKFKDFSQVRNGLFLGLALADSLRQLHASSCIVTRFLILPKANGEGALTHFQSLSSMLQASISTMSHTDPFGLSAYSCLVSVKEGTNLARMEEAPYDDVNKTLSMTMAPLL